MLQIHPVQEDQYNGKSLLRFSHQCILIHANWKKPDRVKQIASSTVSYQRPLYPPHTDDTVDTKKVTSSTIMGNQISKRFQYGIFPGTIVATWTNDNHIQQWRVKCDDDDGKDLTL